MTDLNAQSVRTIPTDVAMAAATTALDMSANTTTLMIVTLRVQHLPRVHGGIATLVIMTDTSKNTVLAYKKISLISEVLQTQKSCWMVSLLT